MYIVHDRLYCIYGVCIIHGDVLLKNFHAGHRWQTDGIDVSGGQTSSTIFHAPHSGSHICRISRSQPLCLSVWGGWPARCAVASSPWEVLPSLDGRGTRGLAARSRARVGVPTHHQLSLHPQPEPIPSAWCMAWPMEVIVPRRLCCR